jgi:restriction system protein
MSENSLFAVLLRSPWWISLAIAVAVSLVMGALLPAEYRPVGVLSSFPFLVIAGMAGVRQWRQPSATRVALLRETVSRMPWKAFGQLLEDAFKRDGYAVHRRASEAFDFEIERHGRKTLVSARRWKSARTGIEPLRALHDARERSDATDAVYVCLGELTETAAPFATVHRVSIWQAGELARVLKDAPLSGAGAAQ